MEPHGFTNDFRGDEYSIYIIRQYEDGCDNEGMRPVTKLSRCDDNGWDVADHHSQVGNEAQDTNHESDKNRKIQPQNQQGHRNEKSIDKAHDELASKETDEIRVDLTHERDDFIFQRRGAEGKVAAPVFGDRCAVFEEKEEEDRHENHTEEEAKDSEESTKAALKETPRLNGEIGDFLLHPVPGVLDRLTHKGGELFICRLIGLIASKEVERGKAVQILKSAGRERLRLLHVSRKILHESVSLAIGGRDDVNEQSHKKSGEGEVNEDDADQTAQAEPHRKSDDRLKKKGKDGRDSYGREDRLQKRNRSDNERANEQHRGSNGQKRKRCDGRPEGFGLKWGRVHAVYLPVLLTNAMPCF